MEKRNVSAIAAVASGAAKQTFADQMAAADAIAVDSVALGERDSNFDVPLDEPDGEDEPPESAQSAGRNRHWWVDLLVFLALTAIAAMSFYSHARGDLYSDEADYALASTRGFEANRWDRSDSPREPDRLIAARHYHAPLTVDLIAVAHRFGADDRTIRMPFILCGGLAIGVVYLCGIALFDRRREIAAACALLTAISPPIVRMASHALPWSPIILELMLLLWCLAAYPRNRRWGWAAGAIAVLGLIFVTSEMFFVAGAATLAAAPILAWQDFRTATDRRKLLVGLGVGAALFAAIALVFWPSGVTGDSVRMLRHYIMMRHSESFPVNVGNRIYLIAPKWSYEYWYWFDYKPFSVCYLLAIPGLLGLAIARRLNPSHAPLLSMGALLLFAAHRAHIIGPEYLAHCLPFLALMGGLAIYGLSLAWRPLGAIAIALLAIPILRWSPRVPLPGMDARAQVSRWPAAARALAATWKPGDKIIAGSQPVNVAHWYLVYVGGVPPIDSQFQPMPVHAPKPAFLERLAAGTYRYAAVSNMFEDHVDLDSKTAHILHSWPIAWKSDEHGAGPSRLIIYRSPR